MNLKEDIISRGIGYEGNNFQTNYFLSNLAKGFIKDKEIFGEDVVSLYSDIFGQESGPLFEAFYEDADVLEESITLGKELLFEDPRPYRLNFKEYPSSDGKFVLSGERAGGIMSHIRSKMARELGGDRAADSMKLSQKSGSLSDVAADDTAYDRQHDKEETSNQSSWDKGVKHDTHDKHDTSTWDKGNKHDTAADNSTGSHGAKAMGIDDTTATDVPVKKTGLLDTVMAKTGKSQGFLAGLWDKIKHFGGGIKAYLTGHPGLATGLKIAGGVGALAIALRAAHKAKLARQQQRRA